jgi:hypothetical protein
MTTKTSQLILLDAQPDWRLDERTRRLGREGIARARAALQAGRRSRSPDESDDLADARHGQAEQAERPGPASRPGAAVHHRRPAVRRPAARRPAA